jgi:YgiT-type zinc finger domain-containing protein
MKPTICNVCGNSSFEERLVDDIYDNPDGEKFVIEHIPATVCSVCGERTLSVATTRRLFAMLDARNKATSLRTIAVLEYDRSGETTETAHH